MVLQSGEVEYVYLQDVPGMLLHLCVIILKMFVNI